MVYVEHGATRWQARELSLTATLRWLTGSANAIHPLEWHRGIEPVRAARMSPPRGPLPVPSPDGVCACRRCGHTYRKAGAQG